MFLLDTHCDTPSHILRLRDLALDNKYAHVDFPKLSRGGVDGAFFALYTPAALSTSESYAYAYRLLNGVRQMLESHSDKAKAATTRDEAYANEVLDDVAEQLSQLLEDLKQEKDSFKRMGIDYEEKAFYDILKAVAKKYEFEYPEDKMIELSKEIKKIIDDKSKYTDYLVREDIKANLQFDLAVILDEYGYQS